MSIFEFEETPAQSARMRVVGVGGGGGNAVNRMIEESLSGVEFISVNTDAQALLNSKSDIKIQIGKKLTRGLGAGARPEIGRQAIEENRDEVLRVLANCDLVFVTCGMGGGTGTGSISVVAEVCRQAGCLTIGAVTKPFAFEGAHRMRNAEQGIAQLIEKVDTLIIVPNDRLLSICDQKTTVDNAFKMADEALRQGVKAISELITVPGIINLDFADVKSIMKNAGPAWMSIGMGSGKDRAVTAAKEAVSSPLLEVPINGATGVMFNVAGSSNLTLHEVNQAAEVIRGVVAPDANIIFGVTHDASLENDVKITLIATGFRQNGITDKQVEQHIEELKEVKKSEADMDMPSFMRHPLFSRRVPGSTPANVPNRTQVR
jgi:cell division protein FtsZ